MHFMLKHLEGRVPQVQRGQLEQMELME
jgi:hypothetical protein